MRTRIFNGDIIRGILREKPTFDLVRVQDVGLSGHPDPDVLRWAAEQGRIVLTHDLASMPYYGEQRVTQGHPMPGIIAVRRNLPTLRSLRNYCSSNTAWNPRNSTFSRSTSR